MNDDRDPRDGIPGSNGTHHLAKLNRRAVASTRLTPGTGEDVCPACQGKGKRDGRACSNCGGTGRVIKAIGGA